MAEVRRRCGLQGSIVRWCPACTRRNALSRVRMDGERAVRQCLYCGAVVEASEEARAERLAQFEAGQAGLEGPAVKIPEEARRPRITKQIRDRLGRLLPMEYRPSEIAAELGIHKDTLYRGWIPAGAPHRIDTRGEIWIVGVDLAAWLRSLIAKPRVTLGPGQAFCLRCQRAVEIQDPEDGAIHGAARLVRGTCPQCGSMVSRFESVGGDSDG